MKDKEISPPSRRSEAKAILRRRDGRYWPPLFALVDRGRGYCAAET